MKTYCIIPARIGSTRLPRKMLVPVQGVPLIQRTYQRVLNSNLFDDIWVATDDLTISNLIENIGGKTIMTDSKLKTGTDRVAFAANKLTLDGVIVNIQGDQPFVKDSMLKALVSPILNGDCQMSTISQPLMSDDHNNPDVAKVICDMNQFAIYFSRSLIPYPRNPSSSPLARHHVGIYAFEAEFLQTFSQLPQTPLEQSESLEQLRAIEHQEKIKVIQVNETCVEINTQADIDRLEDPVLS